MRLRIVQPETEDLRIARDHLLTEALRDGTGGANIDREYPLVLGEGGTRYSYCIVVEEKVVAHANFWPRIMVESASKECFPVALVGNVATDRAFRGQGLMAQLMAEFKELATKSDLGALLLWSDLAEFYQKLAFQSCGREHRFTIGTDQIRPVATGRGLWRLVDRDALTLAHCQAFLRLRAPTAVTLARSPDEMLSLLQIPGLLCMVHDAPGEELGIDGFALMGRGMDMVGVIHEWGADDGETLLGAVALAQELTALPAITILAPFDLPHRWRQALAGAGQVADFPMAWCWTAPGAAKSLDTLLAKSFVWGLDSI